MPDCGNTWGVDNITMLVVNDFGDDYFCKVNGQCVD